MPDVISEIAKEVSAREELARLINNGVGTWQTPLEAADAILAALAPREVTTEAELDALGFQAVVLDPCGTPAVCQRSTQTESFWEPARSSMKATCPTVPPSWRWPSERPGRHPPARG